MPRFPEALGFQNRNIDDVIVVAGLGIRTHSEAASDGRSLTVQRL